MITSHLLPPVSIPHLDASLQSQFPDTISLLAMSEANSTWVTYGPDANCTLALCPAEWSIYHYRPSLAANSLFIALFGLSLATHIFQGVKWRSWTFLFCMFWGCVSEIIGYGGRIMMWQNPFSFTGFMIQIGKHNMVSDGK